MNALYCKDASKKVRAAKAVLAKQESTLLHLLLLDTRKVKMISIC